MKITCKYSVKLAVSDEDVRKTQALRGAQFCASRQADGLDVDAYDEYCKHVLIENRETGALHACFRFKGFSHGKQLGDSYSGQYYDLSRLGDYPKPMIEIGRFCVKESVTDHEPFRIAWAYLSRHIDANDIALIFGCSSFQGTDADRYRDAFALLKERHLAPEKWKPLVKAGEIVEFAQNLQSYKPVLKLANQHLPPMLRSYLGLGGWVSDHAVVDRNLDTLHVFTGVEVGAIPEVRARLLRAHAKELED